MDGMLQRYHPAVAARQNHRADKHQKDHASKDQGKLESDSPSDGDSDEAGSGDVSSETGSGDDTTSTGATGGPKIRSGILTTCTQSDHFAMTFDDGPYEYTSALIDLLISENVVATFFVNGKNYW